MDKEHLTKSDFVEHFRGVVNQIKKLEAKNAKEIEEINKSLIALFNKSKNDNSIQLKNEMEKNAGMLAKKIDLFDVRIRGIISKAEQKLKEVKDGEDADEELILDRLVERIHIPKIEELESNIPKLGVPIRDSLELLQGNERLDASAVKGLEELIKKLSPGRQNFGGAAGSIRTRYVDDETPSGSVNGVNKVFTIERTPATGSLKVYKDGQRMKITEDYTFDNNKEITFVDAPLTDSIITVDYRR